MSIGERIYTPSDLVHENFVKSWLIVSTQIDTMYLVSESIRATGT